MLTAKELRNMSEEDMKGHLEDAEKELYYMRNEQSISKKIEKPHLVKQRKKEKARILTILREKQRVQERNNG